jgi:hypothetical protein
MQSESALVSIELLESTDPALAWLEAHTEVDDIRVDALRIDFRFLGDKRLQSALLRELIERDFGLVAFSPRQSGIESLLLELITDVET